MSYDKVVNSEQLDNIFTDIANSIRSKNGETVQYAPEEMGGAIEEINIMPTINCVKKGSQEADYFKITVNTGLSEITYFFLLQCYNYVRCATSVFYSPQKSFIKDSEGGAPVELTSNIATINVSGGNITIEMKGSYTFYNDTYQWIACGKL